MKLPGKPFNVKLKCPSCGWGFDLGLRKIDEVGPPSPGEERCVVCCSKCLANIDFKLDGSDAKVMTREMVLALPHEEMMAILKGEFFAWLSQQGDPLQ